MHACRVRRVGRGRPERPQEGVTSVCFPSTLLVSLPAPLAAAGAPTCRSRGTRSNSVKLSCSPLICKTGRSAAGRQVGTPSGEAEQQAHARGPPQHRPWAFHRLL